MCDNEDVRKVEISEHPLPASVFAAPGRIFLYQISNADRQLSVVDLHRDRCVKGVDVRKIVLFKVIHKCFPVLRVYDSVFTDTAALVESVLVDEVVVAVCGQYLDDPLQRRPSIFERSQTTNTSGSTTFSLSSLTANGAAMRSFSAHRRNECANH